MNVCNSRVACAIVCPDCSIARHAHIFIAVYPDTVFGLCGYLHCGVMLMVMLMLAVDCSFDGCILC